jgi:hypothetical protein
MFQKKFPEENLYLKESLEFEDLEKVLEFFLLHLHKKRVEH